MRAQQPSVSVWPDAPSLADAVSERLLSSLRHAQEARGEACVVLTGGGIGIAVLDAVRRSPRRDSVDWARVTVWWGDERFVDAADTDRNELQARRALLDHLDLPPDRIHPMPAADGPAGADVDGAAARYAQELGEPAFDVLLLGMGSEGHTASIFPATPAVREQRTVFAVRDCPKPPPTRVSLGFAALNAAREVWLIVTGAEKAPAVAAAIAGADPWDLPAAGVRGRERTHWLLDAAAAQSLAPDLS